MHGRGGRRFPAVAGPCHRSALLGRLDPPLREPLEALEGVVDEDPVLVAGLRLLLAGRHRGRARDLEVDVGEVVEVGGVVDALDLHGDGGGPLADVLPVDAAEEGLRPDLGQAALGAHAPLSLGAEALHQGAGVLRDGHLGREHQRLPPRHHLAVRLLGGLRAEGRVACAVGCRAGIASCTYPILTRTFFPEK